MNHLVSLLRKGGIAVIPTDTIYGVVASARDRKAVARLYALRRTTPGKPFIVLIASPKELSHFGVTLTPAQKAFVDVVWPGKVSVIFTCESGRFAHVHQGTKTLAFRVPKSKKLHELLVKAGPLVAPSANPEGKKPAETLKQAKAYFGNKIGIYVGAGRRLRGEASTLVAYTEERPRVIRQGSVRIPSVS